MESNSIYELSNQSVFLGYTLVPTGRALEYFYFCVFIVVLGNLPPHGTWGKVV